MNKQEQYIFNTIEARVIEMMKNPLVQQKMMSFKKDEEARAWVVKAAIATLMGK